MRQESLLDGSNLPDYEKLASYVFFTATGEEFAPEQIRREDWFIGSSRLYDVFLIYERRRREAQGHGADVGRRERAASHESEQARVCSHQVP